MTSRGSHLDAVFLAVLGFSLWVCSDACLKMATTTGAPKYEVVGIASLISMAVVFVISVARGRVKQLRPQNWGSMIFIGALMTAGYFVFMLSFKRLPLANFYAVVFMSPMIVSLAASALLKEKTGLYKIAAIIFGFLGVLVAVDAFSANPQGDRIGYIYAFIGMLMIAAQHVTLRFVGAKESLESKSFCPRIVVFVSCLAASLVWGIPAMSDLAWLCTLGVGIIASLGWLCVAEAYKRAPAAIVAPFHYSQIVTGAILGYAVWGDVPSGHLMLGASIIIASGIWVALQAHQHTNTIDA